MTPTLLNKAALFLVLYLLLSDLELLPGVIPLFREHGRGSLRPLNHFFLLAQLPLLCVEYFNCWFEENTGKHLQAFIKSNFSNKK